MEHEKHELYQLLCDVPDFGYFGNLNEHIWGVTPIAKHRDSDILGTVNYDKISAELLEKFPDSFDTMQANHWAVGWIEHLLVNSQDEEALEALDSVLCALASYPVYDDDAFSEAEYEAECEDYINNMHSELERMWEKDDDNIPIPEGAVWQLPKMVDQEQRYWTTEFGGHFETESEARNFYLDEVDPEGGLEAEFPESLDAERCLEFYKEAMEDTNQYWEENSWPDLKELYPSWRAAILKTLSDDDQTVVIPPPRSPRDLSSGYLF